MCSINPSRYPHSVMKTKLRKNSSEVKHFPTTWLSLPLNRWKIQQQTKWGAYCYSCFSILSLVDFALSGFFLFTLIHLVNFIKLHFVLIFLLGLISFSSRVKGQNVSHWLSCIYHKHEKLRICSQTMASIWMESAHTHTHTRAHMLLFLFTCLLICFLAPNFH